MTTQTAEYPNLYSITGNVLDINTLLINRNDYRSQAAEIARLQSTPDVTEGQCGHCGRSDITDAAQRNSTFQLKRALKAEAEIERLRQEYAFKDRQIKQFEGEAWAFKQEIERLRLDAERIDWIQRHLFGHKWNGVIDSGSKTTWDIWSGFRHITQAMVGNTFREAIDAARAALGEA